MGGGLLREKALSNVQQTEARGAKVVVVAREGDSEAEDASRCLLRIPEAAEILEPIVSIIPLQLLAYRVAKARALDVDKPRNLAKSATVE